MRDLGPDYDAVMEGAEVQPRWRVEVAGWGGLPDPFDLTPYVDTVSVSRPLRGGLPHASVSVDNRDGLFDPLGGTYGEVVRAHNGEVRIDMGAVVAGAPMLVRVFTGGVLESVASYSAGPGPLVVEVGPRGRDLADAKLSSVQYGGEGVLPASWQANDVVRDLFCQFAGFTDPADFNLAPLDFEIAGVQFEGESLWTAASSCLQPQGYCLRFGYDGRLESFPVLPASWAPVLTVRAAALEQGRFAASRPPEATRILVAGGPTGETQAIIGDEVLWAKSRYAWDHPGENNILGGGDCYRYVLPWGYGARYYLAGPKGQKFRRSEVRNVTLAHCSGGTCATDPFQDGYAPYVVQEWWNVEEERMECRVDFDTGDHDDLWIDFSFEVWGHPYDLIRAPIDAQAWDDELIKRYGEKRRTVHAAVATTYELADRIARDEMVFAQKSVLGADGIAIPGCDLRLEPGDVHTFEKRQGPSVDVWLLEVTHAMGAGGALTTLAGYVVGAT